MSSTARIFDNFTAKVVNALENPDYDWRTISGIASEIKEPETRILATLHSLSNLVRTTDSQGQTLYTTRRHYEKTHGIKDRFVSALTDRVVL